MLMWLMNIDFAGTDAQTAAGTGQDTGRLDNPNFCSHPATLLS